jgi:hypothetical protein
MVKSNESVFDVVSDTISEYNTALQLITEWYDRVKIIKVSEDIKYYKCPICYNVWEVTETPKHYDICWIPMVFEGEI